MISRCVMSLTREAPPLVPSAVWTPLPPETNRDDPPRPMRFDRPPPEPLASAPGFLLSWNGRRTAHEFTKALEPLGLRPPHFGVMTLIDTDPGLTQQELAERSLIDP